MRRVHCPVRALALCLLCVPAALAQAPPATASCRDLPHVPLSQLPEGIAGCARLTLDTGIMQTPRSQWTWRDFQAPVLLQSALSIAGRVEIGLALPVTFHVDPQPSDAAHAFIANRVTAGPLRLDTKLVFVRRAEEAGGFGLAARIWNDFALPGVDDPRVSTGLAAVADWRFARGIVLAANAGLTFGFGYQLDRPAAESIIYGAGFRAPLGSRLALLVELDGRAALPGTTGSKLDAWLGLRVRDGRVFFTLAAGVPLLARDAVLLHFAMHWDGGARVRPKEPEDIELPEHGCVRATCSKPRIAAVARAHVVQIDAVRRRLLRLGDLIELRFRVRAGEPDKRDLLHLRIPNDLSIKNDAERKRELSIRFLIAAFARGGIPIDRGIAAALLDRTGWRVKVERDIDEPIVDYFSFDMRTLAAAYASLLRADAERLRLAQDALRGAWVETDAIFLDIGRAHANGLIGVVNGVIDLPLAPYNLVQFIRDQPGFHIGRIPHLDYKSEWGHEFGGAMELGVALGTMTGPGSAIFAGLGRTVAPAVAKLEELSALAWNGLPVGKFIQTLLVKWMQGSVFAMKAHVAGDMGEIILALATGQIRMPDGTYRPMRADEFEQLVFAFIQDAAVAKAIIEGEREVEGRTLSRYEIGKLGEKVGRAYLEREKYTNIVAIQNKSGHGIDLVALAPDGKVRFFEVKASPSDKPPKLSEAQRDVEKFVRSRLELAAGGRGHWKNAPQAVKDEAARLFNLIEDGDLEIQGMVIEITDVQAVEPKIKKPYPW